MARATEEKPSRDELLEIIRDIPGYDSTATAGPGQWFDDAAARAAIRFFPKYLTHVKGQWSGQPVVLKRWQQAVIGNLFGWKNVDGTRRYRTLFFFVPRKNGKSTLAAGIAIYLLLCDREGGPEVYSAAYKRDQANIVWDVARLMIQRSPQLAARCKIFKSLRSIIPYDLDRDGVLLLNSDGLPLEGGGFYRPLPGEDGGKGEFGANPHAVVNDELHVWRSGDLLDAMQTGMGVRRQPLMVHLTTADFERPESVCNEMHDYAREVAHGEVSDPSFLPVLYEVTPEQIIADPKCWTKIETIQRVNPNWAEMNQEAMLEDMEKAKRSPRLEGAFKRFHLNLRTEIETRWIDPAEWRACAVGPEFRGRDPGWRLVGRMRYALRGRRCAAALDIGATSDMVSLCLLFPGEDSGDTGTSTGTDMPGPGAQASVISASTSRAYALWWFWMPRDGAEDLSRKPRMPNLIEWGRQGLITLTRGNEIDYAVVERDVLRIIGDYPVVQDPDKTKRRGPQILVDRLFQGGQLCQRLIQHGVDAVKFGQGFYSMGGPALEFEQMVGRGVLHHGGDPVMDWQIRGAAVETDAAGLIKPTKRNSKSKIDGVVTAVMAVARFAAGVEDPRSIYEIEAAERAEAAARESA